MIRGAARSGLTHALDGWAALYRRCGAALFALVLGFFIVGPAVDSMLCHAEPGGDAHAAALADVSDHGPDHPVSEDVCAHGACHQAAPFTPAVASVASTAAPAALRLPPMADAGRRFDLLFGLERPPRA